MKRILKSTAITVALAAFAPAHVTRAGSLPYQVVVEKEGPEHQVFAQVTEALTTEGSVDAALVKDALRGFDHYIDEKTENKGVVTLYPQSIFAITKACSAKAWTGNDIRQLLIHIQKEVDEEHRSATKMKRLAVGAIEAGKPLPGVIESLEASEGDEDDDD